MLRVHEWCVSVWLVPRFPGSQCRGCVVAVALWDCVCGGFIVAPSDIHLVPHINSPVATLPHPHPTHTHTHTAMSTSSFLLTTATTRSTCSKTSSRVEAGGCGSLSCLHTLWPLHTSPIDLAPGRRALGRPCTALLSCWCWCQHHL